MGQNFALLILLIVSKEWEKSGTNKRYPSFYFPQRKNPQGFTSLVQADLEGDRHN